MKNYFFIFIATFLITTKHGTLSSKQASDYTQAVEHISQLVTNNSHLHIGCEIYSLQQQQTLYSHNSNQLFIPASNTKLFTAALARKLLDLDYQFTTELSTDGTMQNSILDGNMYIKGTGDPSLKNADIENILKHLSAIGLTRITGNLYIDNTDFDNECFAPGSLVDNLGASWNSPVSALMIDRQPIGLHAINNVTFMNASLLQNMFFDGVTFFEELFKKYDIAFSGTIEFKQSPDSGNTLHTHRSEPIATLLSDMLKKSDNLYADCIFKKLGATAYGYPGTWQKGSDALTDFMLNTLKANRYGFVAKDGSGRSRYNLFTPHEIITLLHEAYTQPDFAEFANSLAIAGIDGSLKNRLLDLTSCVKAKTGTLDGVSGLSGYIFTADDILAFSIMVNAYITDSLYAPACKREVEDAICRILYAA